MSSFDAARDCFGGEPSCQTVLPNEHSALVNKSVVFLIDRLDQWNTILDMLECNQPRTDAFRQVIPIQFFMQQTKFASYSPVVTRVPRLCEHTEFPSNSRPEIDL